MNFIKTEKLTDEIEGHGLDGLVEIVHRDVYKDGFLLERKRTREEGAVFLVGQSSQICPTNGHYYRRHENPSS